MMDQLQLFKRLVLFLVSIIQRFSQKIIFISGTKYVHGSIAKIIYVASGSTVDWTFGTANMIFSYGVELRDTGNVKYFQKKVSSIICY
jgi:hypothetical protein